jgi:hypothetical protein
MMHYPAGMAGYCQTGAGVDDLGNRSYREPCIFQCTEPRVNVNGKVLKAQQFQKPRFALCAEGQRIHPNRFRPSTWKLSMIYTLCGCGVLEHSTSISNLSRSSRLDGVKVISKYCGDALLIKEDFVHEAGNLEEWNAVHKDPPCW